MYTAYWSSPKNIRRPYSRICIGWKLNWEQTINWPSVFSATGEPTPSGLKNWRWNKGSEQMNLSWPASSLNKIWISLYTCVHYLFFHHCMKVFGLLHWRPIAAAGHTVILQRILKLPEVVESNQRKPLFDPYSDFAIANAMERALAMLAFPRAFLSSPWPLKQGARFSWETKAHGVPISAMERNIAEARCRNKKA